MCTMTWSTRPGGYSVFFNRDERRTRGPARGPEIRRHRGARFIAPADGEFGGSWIAVNEFGLTLCLLNGYEAGDEEPPARGEWISRCLLVSALVDCRFVEQVEERCRQVELERYRSFVLAWLVPDRPGRTAVWRKERLSFAPLPDPAVPLVSSSFATRQVRAGRQAQFAGLESTGDNLERHLLYHESHQPERGPYSVCMHRSDAKTVSFSRVQVDPRGAEFHYSPRSPCRGRPEDAPVRLPRFRPDAVDQ
jgi:hypothetical protein